jgi:hypothetical protein
MVTTTAATQTYLQPSEEATGWGVFLPGDAPPHFAAELQEREESPRREERFAHRGVSSSTDRLKVSFRSRAIIGLGPRLG